MTALSRRLDDADQTLEEEDIAHEDALADLLHEASNYLVCIGCCAPPIPFGLLPVACYHSVKSAMFIALCLVLIIRRLLRPFSSVKCFFAFLLSMASHPLHVCSVGRPGRPGCLAA